MKRKSSPLISNPNSDSKVLASIEADLILLELKLRFPQLPAAQTNDQGSSSPTADLLLDFDLACEDNDQDLDSIRADWFPSFPL